MVTKPTLNSPAKADSKKPVKVFRSGSVKGSIWENEFKLADGTVRKSHSVTVVRSYKVKDSEDWAETNSYNPDSLADLETVASECRRYLKLKE
jgi:hypothetical protein